MSTLLPPRQCLLSVVFKLLILGSSWVTTAITTRSTTTHRDLSPIIDLIGANRRPNELDKEYARLRTMLTAFGMVM